MESISVLCTDLGLPLDDARVLVLLWKLGAASRPGEITLPEWTTGLAKLSCKSLADMKALLPSLDSGFISSSGKSFKELSKFAFKFNLEGSYKTMEKELAIGLLDVLLLGRNNSHGETFKKFLEQSKDPNYNRVTLDQWTSFFEFSTTFGSDLTAFDTNSSWPVLLDDYVSWMKSGQNVN